MHASINSTIVRVIILMALFNSQEVINAQSEIVCEYCRQQITSKYIEARGKYFHPEHFICSKCNKILGAEYKVMDDKYYHPDCYAFLNGFVCAFCDKLINEKYYKVGEKKYHIDCYNDHVLLKCSICNQSIRDSIKEDMYGNKFHAYHKYRLNECEYCGRLICESLTGGGVVYADGRKVCRLCLKTSVFDEESIKSLLKEVIIKLDSIGIHLHEEVIIIRGLNRNEMMKTVKYYTNSTKGFCKSEVQTKIVDGLKTKISSHQIFILRGIPYYLMGSFIAHELMHTWLKDSTRNNHSSKIREGSCNYIRYLYLESLPESISKYYKQTLNDDPEPIYGNGFRQIKNKFKELPLSDLLVYLKN